MKHIFTTTLMIFSILATVADAAPTPTVTIPPPLKNIGENKLYTEDLVLHRLEDGKYTEVWFFQIHADDGGLMMINLSVTNAGLGKWSSSVDVWYHKDGKVSMSHNEYDADRLAFDKKKLKLTIGESTFEGYPPKYWLIINEPKASGRISIDLGNSGAAATRSKSYYDGKKESFLDYTVLALGARSAGEIVIDGRRISLDGFVYGNHQNGNLLPPNYCKNWYSFAGMQNDFSFYLASKDLVDDLSPDIWKMLIIVQKGRVIGYLNDFELEPIGRKTHADSGYNYAPEFALSAAGEDWSLQGSLKLQKIDSWVDILQHLSGLVRLLIKTFYTNPWSMRGSYRYDFTLTRGGQTEKYSGDANTDNSFFDQ